MEAEELPIYDTSPILDSLDIDLLVKVLAHTAFSAYALFSIHSGNGLMTSLNHNRPLLYVLHTCFLLLSGGTLVGPSPRALCRL